MPGRRSYALADSGPGCAASPLYHRLKEEKEVTENLEYPVGGAVTYRNYFRMSAGENYVIRARIRRPGTAEVATELALLAHAQTLPTGK